MTNLALPSGFFRILVDLFVMVKIACLAMTDDYGIHCGFFLEINYFAEILAFRRNDFCMTTNISVIST